MGTTPGVEHSTRGSWSDELAVLVRCAGVPMAIGIGIASAVSSAVGYLVVEAFAGWIDRVDLDVVQGLVDSRTGALDGLTAAAVFLADTLPVAVLWIAAMVVAARRTGHLLLPVFLLFVIGGEKLTYLLTSRVVGRPRPPVETLGHVFATNSFPSGHVGSAVALYGAMVVAVRRYRSDTGRPIRPPTVAALGAAVVAVVMLVAFSRVYRGQHYPSDVVWGAVLGAAWLGGGVRLVLDRWGDPVA